MVTAGYVGVVEAARLLPDRRPGALPLTGTEGGRPTTALPPKVGFKEGTPTRLPRPFTGDGGALLAGDGEADESMDSGDVAGDTTSSSVGDKTDAEADGCRAEEAEEVPAPEVTFLDDVVLDEAG